MHLNLRNLFLKHVAQTSDAPAGLEISHASGNYIFDTKGKKYLDLISGISVSSLGHANPYILAAVHNQAEKHMHTMVYGEHIQQPQVQLASLLQSQLPRGLDTVYFVNSGTEATEGAMKLAKRMTGRHSFTALRGAYHGSTQGALSLMDSEYFTASFRPLLPLVQFMEPGNQKDVDSCIHENTAAVVIELVQSEQGAVPLNRDFVQRVRERCMETKTLLIVDEIQTGIGRTGTFLACEQFDIVPDILLLGKALGGGMPLAAFIASHKLMMHLSHEPILGHITTFGGHPVSCAASLAALEWYNEHRADLEVTGKHNFFKQCCSKYGLPQPEGLGLLLSLNFGTAEKCKSVMQHCMNQGIHTDWFLFAPHKLRIAPPLTITMQELDFAAQTIANAG